MSASKRIIFAVGVFVPVAVILIIAALGSLNTLSDRSPDMSLYMQAVAREKGEAADDRQAAKESSAAAPEGPGAASRFSCLIIRSLTGADDTTVTPGFPPYKPFDENAKEESIKPAAERTAPLLGTDVRVAVYDMAPAEAEAAIDAAFARIVEISGKMNIFEAASEVSRINRTAADAPQPLSDDLYNVLRKAVVVSSLSDGAFDVTVGPLTTLWREARRAGKLPTEEEIKSRRALVGWKKMTLDAEHHTVTFAVKGMSLDLGGIAKGYAAEEAEQTLLKLRVKSAIVACGGEIRCIGSRPGGRPFRIGIQSPTPGGKGGLRFVVDVVDSDVSTSGNYIQFSMIGGKMYSHIIDPRTGMSIEALPSVTVVGPDGTYCDALTKPIIILGEKEGLAFLERANRELIPAR